MNNHIRAQVSTFRLLVFTLFKLPVRFVTLDPISRGAVFTKFARLFFRLAFDQGNGFHFLLFFFLLGCLATAALAILTALPSSPVFSSTAFAVLFHCCFLAGVFAFFVCFMPLLSDQGIVTSQNEKGHTL